MNIDNKRHRTVNIEEYTTDQVTLKDGDDNESCYDK